MSEPQRGRILFVDDEPLVLSGLRRAMAGAFTIETASSGAEGLAILGAAAGDEPFAVVVSDMMMPAMTGAEFLVRARDVAPDAVLMILSGQADLRSTVEAVNNAKLFRFLTKPCSAEDIGRSLDDALRQHQLVTAERELLERTLLGAIDTLMKVLAIANPTVFGRASRVADLVGATATRLGCVSWELRVAALLSQIGGVALPDELVESVRYGAPLSEEEAAVYATHRQVAADLVSSIPRLERVAEWIGSQPIAPAPGRTGHVYTSGAADVADLPIERVILHATIAYLAGRQSGLTPPEVVTRLSAVYPSRVVLAINAESLDLQSEGANLELSIADLRPGMVLEQDVLTDAGLMLVRSGECLDNTLLARLRNFKRTVGVAEPIRVLMPSRAATATNEVEHAAT